MNVFEDLINERKAGDVLEANHGEGKDFANNDSDAQTEVKEILRELAELEEQSALLGNSGGNQIEDLTDTIVSGGDLPASEIDVFRKRAMYEVSSLQMVEHVISAIEREHRKVVPTAFDDLNVKKALDEFLQVSDPDAPLHIELEYQLLQETGQWAFALGERDGRISVANLRRFCERSRPPLSSQALLALARFYRNSIFSEDARSKFEVLMTRLVAREIDGEKRQLLFAPEEIAAQITALYMNWSGISLYSVTENEEDVALAVSRFNDLIIEAECAETFDELLEVDFFEKLRAFKESLAELFYTPEVCASGIICNVKVGNRYVELIQNEKVRTKIATVEQKYGYTYDQLISDSASKTLLLVNLLNTQQFEETGAEARPSFDEVFPVKSNLAAAARHNDARSRLDVLGVNKWLVAGALLLIAVSVGIYFWAENASSTQSSAIAAAEVAIEDPEIRQHLRSGRGSGETFYGIVQPSWDAMSESSQIALLGKSLKFGRVKGFKRVTLINSRGRTVGSASDEKTEILKP